MKRVSSISLGAAFLASATFGAEMELNLLASNPVCFELPGDEYVAGARMTADGKFLVTSQRPRAVDGQVLRRFHLDGRRDESFAEMSAAIIDSARITPLRDGSYAVLVRSGEATTSALLKLTANGVVDAAFAQPNWTPINEIEEAESGRLYLLLRDGRIARVEADGQSASFVSLPEYARASDFLEVAADGAIYTVLASNPPGASTTWTFSRINPEGVVDPSFNPPFRPSTIQLRGAELYAVEPIASPEVLAYRLLPSGAMDPSFGPIPMSALVPGSGAPASKLPLVDDAGWFYGLKVIPPYRHEAWHLYRYDAAGNVDPAFRPGLFHQRLDALGVCQDGLYVVGEVRCRPPLPRVEGRPEPIGVIRYALNQSEQRIILWPEWVGAMTHFRVTTVTTAREDLTASIEIARTGPNEQAAAVWYRARAGTAQEGSDFAAHSGEIQFAAGQTKASAVAPLIPDTLPERTETFYLDFFTEQGAALGSITIEIPNDDQGLAINFPTRLPDGRWRVLYAHNSVLQRPVWSSTDLVNWSPYPTYSLDYAQYIDIDPAGEFRFFRTEPNAGFYDLPAEP